MREKSKLPGKDLINVEIYTAIYFLTHSFLEKESSIYDIFK